MDDLGWTPRRVTTVTAALPDGVTPPGRRGQILHAALVRYAELGFAGTSIRVIAGDVGINSATLYAHYPSKEHILAELVQIGHEELHARLSEAVDPAEPAREQLASLVRAHALLHTDYPLLAVVTNSELHALSAELAAPALELRAKCRRLLLDILHLGAKEQEFSIPDITLAATAIGGMSMQIAHWYGPDQPRTRQEVADAYAQFALRIVGADPADRSTR